MTGDLEDQNAAGRRLTALLSYTAIVTFGLTFQSLPPLLGFLRTDLGLTYGDAGFLVGLFSLPGIIVTIPIGLAADSYGPRRVGTVALAAMTIGMIVMAVGTDFVVVAGGRIISGIGGLALSIVAAQMISRRFVGRALSRAMGVYNTGMPLGTVIAFLSFGSLAAAYTWRLPLALVGAVCGTLGLLFPRLYSVAFPRGTSRTREVSGFVSQLRGIPLSLRSAGGGIWLVGLSWGWFNAAGIAWLGFGPTYFVSRGYSRPLAGFMASSLMVGALVVSPLVGLVMDRFMSKKLLIAGGSVGMGLVFLLLINVSTVMVPWLMLALAIAASLPPAPIFALPADIVRREQFGLAFGILSTCLNIGAVGGPWLVGFLRGSQGNYTLGFMFMAAASWLAAFAILPLKPDRSRT